MLWNDDVWPSGPDGKSGNTRPVNSGERRGGKAWKGEGGKERGREGGKEGNAHFRLGKYRLRRRKQERQSTKVTLFRSVQGSDPHYVFPLILGGKVALNCLRPLPLINATFPPILREKRYKLLHHDGRTVI